MEDLGNIALPCLNVRALQGGINYLTKQETTKPQQGATQRMR